MKCFLATVFLTLSAATANAALIYDVDRTIGDGTVTGFIETDGALGVLSETNIMEWSLTLTAPNLNSGSPNVISSTDGDLILRGAAVTATSTELLYDFDLTPSGATFLFFMGSSTSPYFWCLETVSCSSGDDLSEQIGLDGNVAQLVNHTGTIAFATVVPVPAAAWLFGSGLLGLIGFSRRKR